MPKSRKLAWNDYQFSEKITRERERVREITKWKSIRRKMFRAEHKIYWEEQKWNLIHGEFNEITRDREYKREREKNEKRVQRVYTKMKYLKY